MAKKQTPSDDLFTHVDKTTGEETQGKLNEVIKVVTRRPNGTLRIQQDFRFCPTMAEQHTAHLTDLNYLIEKYKPDELAAYIAARSQYRTEVLGHDFSQELSMQEARNVIYRSQQEFEALPEEIRSSFRNHLEFLKFIDNPANADKMIKLGLLKPQQVEALKGPAISQEPAKAPTTTTQEEAKVP